MHTYTCIYINKIWYMYIVSKFGRNYSSLVEQEVWWIEKLKFGGLEWDHQAAKFMYCNNVWCGIC